MMFDAFCFVPPVEGFPRTEMGGYELKETGSCLGVAADLG